MNYSRKQLYELGEPFGESATRLKPGGRVYGGGGSSAPSTPEKTTQTVELPEWARPYAKDTLAKGAALTDINQNPYKQYGGQRIAGFQPLQEQAFKTVGGMDAGPAGFQAGIGQYMSPYMQNVVDIEKREAGRQSGIMGTQQQAQATQAGAFGGGRDAIMRAERERNLSQQMGDIQSRGSQAAYEQAANQFRQGITQQSGLAQMQGQMGAQQQQQAQRPLDMAYQDFLNQQNYPYKQLGFMSDLVRGMPLGQQSTSQVYSAPPSLMGQLGGLGMGAYGLSKMMAEGGEVKTYAGDYGSVTSEGNVQGIISDLSDLQLQQAKEAALNARDEEQAQMIDQEIARRTALRSNQPQEFAGIAPALTNEFADGMEQAMASGGIVAFADGDVVSDKKTSRFSQTALDKLFNALSPPDAQEQEAERLRKYNEFISASQAQPGFFESVSPEELAKSEKQVQEKATALTAKKPDQTKSSESTKPSKTASPQMSKEQMADIDARNAAIMSGSQVTKEGQVVPPPKAVSTKPTYEDITAGPKPSKKEVKSAVAQFAEQNNLGPDQKEDVMTTALRIREELGKQNQPILDKLNAAIEAQKPDEQALKDRGFAQALTQFGFGMAERASKPGARFLESAAGAAPVIGTVVAETNKLIEAKKDNYVKLQLDQAKYEVALAKGDMQTAATLAGQIRQSQQQDKALDFQSAKAKDELALKERELAQQGAYQNQMASRYETVGSLTRDIMKNEGLPYGNALEKAARMLKPTGYAADVRAGTAQNANLDKALKDIDAKQKYAFLAVMNPQNPKYAALKAEYEAEKRAAYARYGGGEIAAPSAAISPDAFKIEKISN